MGHIFSDFNRSPLGQYDGPLPEKEDDVIALVKTFVASGLFFPVYVIEERHMASFVCFHKNGGSYDLGYCFHTSAQGSRLCV